MERWLDFVATYLLALMRLLSKKVADQVCCYGELMLLSSAIAIYARLALISING